MSCRLDPNDPKQLNFQIDLTSNPPLHCLLEKIDLIEIPASEEVKWEFCVLNAGKSLLLLDSSSSVKSHLDEVAGVGWSSGLWKGCLLSTHQENLLNRVGNPEIVAASDNLCSDNIEDSLEEIIRTEILNLDEFYFLMIKKLRFDVSTLKQNCSLVDGAEAHSVQKLYWGKTGKPLTQILWRV